MGRVERVNRKLRHVSIVMAIAFIVQSYYSIRSIYAILPVSVGIIVLVALVLSIVRDSRQSRT